jgi:DNA-binding NarL/FixJ family response regulator
MSMDIETELRKRELSKREVEVALKVSTGKRMKDVGAELFITEKTVKFHMTNVYRKLQLKNRLGLIKFIFAIKGEQWIE